MLVSKARWMMDGEGTWLCFRADSPRAAQEVIGEMEEGKRYELTIKQQRKKRSLDSNAYAWTLMDKLAERMAIPKEEIYRGYVRNIGGNCQTVCIKAEAAETLRRIWSGKGLGWVSDTLPSKLPGCENLVLYYGSSEYDTRQMSRLIDMIVQDCKACGIPTATPEEIARMMDRWGA